MKFLTIATILLTTGLQAQSLSTASTTESSDYSPNMGYSAPGSFRAAEEKNSVTPQTTTTTTRIKQETRTTSAIMDRSNSDSEINAAKTDEMNTGVSPSEMNTAPTDTPVPSESDAYGTTLSSGTTEDGTFAPGNEGVERQAQEDRKLDNSTTPDE
ncbi:MAG TPA: hypothetical protein VNJ01_09650 [Bacteriovoracaceae bacterium]|nr:hypothetical protein [Bacteriovoracaceae bacterium]